MVLKIQILICLWNMNVYAYHFENTIFNVNSYTKCLFKKNNLIDRILFVLLKVSLVLHIPIACIYISHILIFLMKNGIRQVKSKKSKCHLLSKLKIVEVYTQTQFSLSNVIHLLSCLFCSLFG